MYPSAWSVKCGDFGSVDWPPVMMDFAVTLPLGPKSIAAMKLFPDEP